MTFFINGLRFGNQLWLCGRQIVLLTRIGREIVQLHGLIHDARGFPVVEPNRLDGTALVQFPVEIITLQRCAALEERDEREAVRLEAIGQLQDEPGTGK
ncbi:MAG: hypothetical protein WCL44_15175 [bacterium]